MSPQTLFFVITYLLKDEQELSLGMLDTLQTYLNFLMLHACFTPIALCFVYTSWHFYAFFGTNLYASSYFLLFLCSKKVTQEIFSELDEMNPEVPYFPNTRRGPKQRGRRARRQPHHLVAHPLWLR
jgi:hypothetical protein